MLKVNQFLTKLNIHRSDTHEFSLIYLKQVGVSTIIKGLSVLISIIYVPLVLGFLDQEKYGIWITLTTIVNWIRLLDVGMGNGLRNMLAEAVALKNYKQGRIYISTTYGILGGIFLLVLLVFYLINPHLNWQAILNSELITPVELVSLTSIVVSFIVLGFILQPITLIYTAHGNSIAGGIIQLIISTASLFLIWIVSVFAEKGNIIILAWIVTGIPVLIYIIVSAYTFLYKYPHLKPSFKLIKISESGNLLRLSAQFFVVQITSAIIYSSIPFIVAQLFSPNEVAVFNISNSIFNVPIMLMAIILTPVVPLVTQAFVLKDFTWLRNMLKKQMIISGVLSVGTLVMVVISPFIYRIWLGDKIFIPFNLSLSIGIYAIIQVLTAPFSTFINAVGKIKILVILGPAGIILFVGLCLGLSHLMKDVVAVSIALSLTSIPALVIIPLVLRKAIYPK